MQAQWQSWWDSPSLLKKLKVNRCLKPSGNVKVHEVHTFADGSQTGYGAVSYLRSVKINGEVCCSFLMGEGYLAKERRTVPRMELLAAVLAVRLDEFLRRELTLHVIKSCFWSDSTATLYSIRNRKKRFPVFVANRLVEIERNTNPDLDWKYVPTDQNPADEETKSFSVKRFLVKENGYVDLIFLGVKKTAGQIWQPLVLPRILIEKNKILIPTAFLYP